MKKHFPALLAITLLFYLLFINRGIGLFDEGYFVHTSERILAGQMIYKDFFFQYPPFYSYLLAFCYKLFRENIITGRFLSILFSLGILLFTFRILDKLEIKSKAVYFLSFLSMVIFGYPAINTSQIIWPTVFVTLLAIYLYINKKRLIYIALALGVLIGLKQSVGIAIFVLFKIFILFEKKPLWTKIKNYLFVDLVVSSVTLFWVYYFFRNNSALLLEFYNYSKNFAVESAFTIPPLSWITQPIGIFKLLPYYLPIIFFFIIIFSLNSKKIKREQKVIALAALIAFFVSMYPQTDLLHLYPYFGFLLVSSFIFFYRTRFFKITVFFVSILLVSGIYWVFIKNSNRYDAPYRLQNVELKIPRAKGIYVEQKVADSLNPLYEFIQTNTKKDDYIFAYPYYPMLYFLMERKNPTRDSYSYAIWHVESEKQMAQEIISKHTRYLITLGPFKFDLPKKQKIVFQKNLATVYEVLY